MFVILVVLLLVGLLAGCGLFEKAYDRSNYESITNETGDLYLYSGGVLIKTYEDVKILYSNADSFAIFFKTKDGDERYWQGEAEFDMK